MARYFFHIAYKGTNYRGWQKQSGVNTVQQVIEDRMQSVFKRKVHCLGCGRTDAEVHASQYFFHADLKESIQDNFLQVFNKILPADIVLYDLIPVTGTPHAQFSATERTYDYFFHTQPNPFLADLSSFYEFDHLDLVEMNRAAKILYNYKDYRAFCKTPDRHDSTLVIVKDVKLFKNKDRNEFRFQITADKFLKNMIRIIVYNLMEVGIGKLTVDEFESFLKHNNPPKYFNLAYPQGLYLSKIKYSFIEIPPQNKLFTIFNNTDWITI